jgi:hypothetical protein
VPKGTLSQDKRQTPTASSDRLALSEIFDDRHIADAALSNHDRAAEMPIEERYQYLSKWVLPGLNHDTIRTSSEFTPAHPAPPILRRDRADADRLQAAGHSRLQFGANLISPALDLIEVASELNRLAELRERVDEVRTNGDHGQRSRLAMLSLIDLENGDVTTAGANLENLARLVAANTDLRLQCCWPETLAMWVGIRHPETRDLLREMAEKLVRQRLQKSQTSGSEAWDRHVTALLGVARYLEVDGSSIEELSLPPSLNQWDPVSTLTARSRGSGFPRSHWQLSGRRLDHQVGHAQDFMYFQIPLRGDFQIECDTSALAWAKTHSMMAGTWFGPFWRRGRYESGTIRGENPHGRLTPPMENIIEWVHVRIVVKNRVMTVFFDGRRIHQEVLPVIHDPWLAIRCRGRFLGSVKNVQISGEPTIPAKLNLAANADLVGWIPYFDESIGEMDSDWLYTGVGIMSRCRAELAGSGTESVLHYQRPMLEDGTIDYDFYYEPGKVETHPILDRLAFILAPDGVRIHHLTDGRHDRTGLSPFNESLEPQNRRGPDLLPLVTDSWNHIQLKLTGDHVDLRLNDQLVFQRRLEAGNQRTFGLFHYADRTESHVRNIEWRGNWPRRLPTPADQTLAEEIPISLDRTLPKLSSVFQHDFTVDGLPQDQFAILETLQRRRVSARSDGLHVRLPGSKGFTRVTLSPQLSLRGDFDIKASFDNLRTTAAVGHSSGVSVKVALKSQPPKEVRVYRGFVRQVGRKPRQIIQTHISVRERGGLRQDWPGVSNEESTSGTLRLARRGDTVYCLFAEEDSPVFRLCGSVVAGSDDVQLDGIRLICATQKEEGSVNVVWKHVSIHAEEFDPLTSEAIALRRLLTNQLTGTLPSSSLEFDGRSQYVTVPSIKYDGSFPITLEAYVTLDRLNGSVIGDTQQSGIGLGVPGRRYKMQAWDGTNYTEAASTNLGATLLRTHLAGTFDGESLSLFVNGKRVNTSPFKGTFGPSGFPLTIGASPSPTAAGIDFPFAGIIDGVRVSRTVRYSKDFTPPAKLESDNDTLAVYHFSKGSGKVLRDASGNEHHGEIRRAKWVDDQAIRSRAALGLAKLGRHAVEVLTETLSHQAVGVQAESAMALGLIGKEATPALTKLGQLTEHKDRRVSTAARQAVAKIQGSSLTESLRNLFK